MSNVNGLSPINPSGFVVRGETSATTKAVDVTESGLAPILRRTATRRPNAVATQVRIAHGAEPAFDAAEIAEYIRAIRQIGRRRGSQPDDGTHDNTGDDAGSSVYRDLEGLAVKLRFGNVSTVEHVLDATAESFATPIEQYWALRYARDTATRNDDRDDACALLIERALRDHEKAHADVILPEIAAIDCARATQASPGTAARFGHQYCRMVSGTDGILGNVHKMMEIFPERPLGQVLGLVNAALSRDQTAVRQAPGRLAQFPLNRQVWIHQVVNTLHHGCGAIVRLLESTGLRNKEYPNGG